MPLIMLRSATTYANGQPAGVVQPDQSSYLTTSRGYYGGGYTGSAAVATIDSMREQDELYATTVMTLLEGARYGTATLTSGMRGYWCSGQSATAVIDALVYAPEITFNTAVALTVGRAHASGVSSSTRGYVIGGSSSTEINGVDFATESSINPSAVLSVTHNYPAHAWTSTVGYIMGGGVTNIEKFTFATESISASTSAPDTATGCKAVFSTLKAYRQGGYTSSYTASISAFTFSGEGFTAVSATLKTARGYMGSASLSSNGYNIGGSNGAVTITIDGLRFTDETARSPSSSLAAGRDFQTGIGYVNVYKSARGYMAGGMNVATSVVSTVQTFNMDLEVFTTNPSTLSGTSYAQTGLNSSSKGYFCGGYTNGSSGISTMAGIRFTDEVVYTPSITLAEDNNRAAGASTSTVGYVLGGNVASAATKDIQKLTFSNETFTLLTAKLATATEQGGCVISSAKVYLGGGYSTTYTNVIHGLTLDTEVCAAISATLSSSRYGVAGLSASAIGYFCGGYTGSAVVSTINTLTFSNETAATSSVNLSGSRWGAAAMQTNNKGYVCGGNTNSSGTTQFNKADCLNFTTGVLTTTTDTIDTPVSREASVSNGLLPTAATDGRGYWVGGYNSVVCDALKFTDKTTIALSTVLSLSRYYTYAVSGVIAGYVGGGSTPLDTYSYSVEALQYDTENTRQIAASLQTGHNQLSGTCTTSKGYWAGGNTGSLSTAIHGLLYATEVMTANSSTLPTATDIMGSVKSKTTAYFCEGVVSSGYTNNVMTLAFSNESTSSLGAAATRNRGNIAGFQSTTTGYLCGGGQVGNATTRSVETLTFASQTIADSFNTLTTATSMAAGVNSYTEGFVSGGNSSTRQNIDSLAFAVGTFQNLSATLTTARYGAASMTNLS